MVNSQVKQARMVELFFEWINALSEADTFTNSATWKWVNSITKYYFSYWKCAEGCGRVATRVAGADSVGPKNDELHQFTAPRRRHHIDDQDHGEKKVWDVKGTFMYAPDYVTVPQGMARGLFYCGPKGSQFDSRWNKFFYFAIWSCTIFLAFPWREYVTDVLVDSITKHLRCQKKRKRKE